MSYPTRPRVRLSTILLAIGVALVLATLWGADRSFVEADRSKTQLDAAEAAALVESFLAVQKTALHGFSGLYLTRTEDVSPERFTALVAMLATELTGFRRVWMTDTSGVVVVQHLFGRPGAPLRHALDIDTLGTLRIAALAKEARTTGQMQVSASGTILTGEQGFALVEPVHVDGQFRGFVVGTVVSGALLEHVLRHEHETRRALAVLSAAGDTVAAAAVGPQEGPLHTATASVQLPNGSYWQMRVTHAAAARDVRVALWGVGLGMVVFLVVAVLYERRQGMRTAERSRELERLSSELLRANRAKSEFLANVSHELRTPLNAIVGFVELLRDDVYGELTPRQVAPVARIAASAGHLRHLVDQVLDLAKMAAGRLEVHAESLDLRAFVLDVVSDVEPLVSEKDLSLSIGVAVTLPRVRTDPNHLRQILVNLVGNAVRYTEQGGISIRARLVGPDIVQARSDSSGERLRARAPEPDKPWIALQVTDTGIGIAPQDQERIFGEFEQVNAGSRGDSINRGSGLGLAISRRLARLLGGDITVESEPGKGSTFTLWLPVSESDLRNVDRARGVSAGRGGTPASTPVIEPRSRVRQDG